MRIGDAGLFSRLLEALDLPPQWRRRIARGHISRQIPRRDLELGRERHRSFRRPRRPRRRRQAGRPRASSRIFSPSRASPRRAAAPLGRSPIVSSNKRRSRPAPDFHREARGHRTIFERRGRSSRGVRAIARACAARQTSIFPPFSTVSTQGSGLIAGQGLDVSKLHFSARFTRNLDYYTGFVFEAYAPGGAASPPSAAAATTASRKRLAPRSKFPPSARRSGSIA